jgi:hypothetical protein
MRFPPLLARFKVEPEELDLLVIDKIKNIDKEMAANAGCTADDR